MMWFLSGVGEVPTPNVRLDVWDGVESYTIHMLLACRLKIIPTSNLELIIFFLVLHIVLLSFIQVAITCCLNLARSLNLACLLCENIPTGISLSCDSAFAHKKKFSIFKFPERFSEISRRDLTIFLLC
jgi:hypothetical protein